MNSLPTRLRAMIAEMRSAVQLSQQFRTPVADHELVLAWAQQLQSYVDAYEQAVREYAKNSGEHPAENGRPIIDGSPLQQE